jgi:hypothetical protein
MSTQHPDFSLLAARISISNLHKSTLKVFSDVVEQCHQHVHPKTKAPASLVSDSISMMIVHCLFILGEREVVQDGDGEQGGAERGYHLRPRF